MAKTPRILLFTGDGKGKTTAALGMAFRASGHGMRTCVVQFIKSDQTVGEITAANASEWIEIYPVGLGFLPPAGDAKIAQHREAAQAGVQKAAELIASNRYQVVILDEICFAVARDLVEEEQVEELAGKMLSDACLVLTGRDAPPALVSMADTVTEMRAIKHCLDTGRKAQIGVER
jgi:cob(I)alamin adenosyltransferase